MRNLHQGQTSGQSDKHRCESVMEAGVAMGIVSKKALNELIVSVHREFFGQAIEDLLRNKSEKRQPKSFYYSQYE